MSDSEWIREHIKEYHSDDVPPCGEDPGGCLVVLGLIGAVYLIFRLILPRFGIDIDPCEMVRDFFFL